MLAKAAMMAASPRSGPNAPSPRMVPRPSRDKSGFRSTQVGRVPGSYQPEVRGARIRCHCSLPVFDRSAPVLKEPRDVAIMDGDDCPRSSATGLLAMACPPVDNPQSPAEPAALSDYDAVLL